MPTDDYNDSCHMKHSTQSTNHMRSILHHITPLIINCLWGRHTHTRTHAHTHTQNTHTHTQQYRHSQTEAILRNQVRACSTQIINKKMANNPERDIIATYQMENYFLRLIYNSTKLFLHISFMHFE